MELELGRDNRLFSRDNRLFSHNDRHFRRDDRHAIAASPQPAVHCKRSRSRTNSACRAPGRIRTCDLRIRSPMLYPAELRALGALGLCCKA